MLLDALKPFYSPGIGGNAAGTATSPASPYLLAPDPELFFTWYCERAREIERTTGDSQAALDLLDSALSRLPATRSLARRFMTATRNSLLRYRAHLAALAAALKVAGEEERGRLLEGIRAADWREYEQQRGGKAAGAGEMVGESVGTLVAAAEAKAEVDTPSPSSSSSCSSSSSPSSLEADWSLEIGLLDAVLQENWSEVSQLAAQLTPAVPESEEQLRHLLLGFCQLLQEELREHRRGGDGTNLRVIPAGLCRDPWSELVEDQIGCSLSLTADEEERMISLLLIKSEMAQSLLKKCK